MRRIILYRDRDLFIDYDRDDGTFVFTVHDGDAIRTFSIEMEKALMALERFDLALDLLSSENPSEALKWAGFIFKA